MAAEFLAAILPGLFSGIGNWGAGRANARATRYAAQKGLEGIEKQMAQAKYALDQTLAWERESAATARKGTELENMRRSQEAMARAAKLEDVAGMFAGMQGPGGLSSLGALTGAGGAAASRDFSALSGIANTIMSNPELTNILADAGELDPALLREIVGEARDVSDIRGIAGGLRDTSRLEGIASELLSADSSADLRTSARRELTRGSDTMAALMAQQGVRGSGFAAGQQRELGADVMGRLASAIAANRRENLLAGAGVMGQATSQQGLAAQLYGQAGQQLLGAGGLAGNLASIEQGNIGLRGDLASAINAQNATAAQILAQQYGLEQQGDAMNIQALSAALSGEASLAGTQAQYNLGRMAQIANLYQDEAFGANLPYNPFEFEAEYDRMEREYNASRGAGGSSMFDFLTGTINRGGFGGLYGRGEGTANIMYPGGSKDFYRDQSRIGWID